MASTRPADLAPGIRPPADRPRGTGRPAARPRPSGPSHRHTPRLRAPAAPGRTDGPATRYDPGFSAPTAPHPEQVGRPSPPPSDAGGDRDIRPPGGRPPSLLWPERLRPG